jgi:hypothetical protein
MQMKNFRLNRASQDDGRWLGEVLNREGKKFGTRVRLDEKGALRVPGGGNMEKTEKEAAEKVEKKEVMETFCGPLKEKQKDKCVQFYEELDEGEQDKEAPEKNEKA